MQTQKKKFKWKKDPDDLYCAVHKCPNSGDVGVYIWHPSEKERYGTDGENKVLVSLCDKHWTQYAEEI